ncbi:50S ribosomal protein L25 [Candidatus Erwinia haradaeae]|uniref:Large ribosomal subunit protein bL25 n=1 Tax=Candidatus Erwinia haradaeae TaxID=1922217 RepID=A0A451D4F3_9GAMM|nr:50S ribosomal protein L25 [Candidatus Erwinia haradaeae]VFP80571.1 50S ribosomal protein L25 [Candidatus Erwinia haradaeae]
MFIIYAENRKTYGTGSSRRLRKADKLPAIIYGGHEIPHSITLNQELIMNMQLKDHFYKDILTIMIEGVGIQVKVHAIQRHPFKEKLQHIDFIRIK